MCDSFVPARRTMNAMAPMTCTHHSTAWAVLRDAWPIPAKRNATSLPPGENQM